MQSFGKITAEIGNETGAIRNSEGAFITLKDGGILFILTRFFEKEGHDDSPSCLCKFISHDGGETWKDKGILFSSKEEGFTTIGGPSLLRMQNDNLGLFYSVREGSLSLNGGLNNAYLQQSTDEGETFGKEAVPISPFKAYYCMNNDRVVRLSSGRLIAPTAQVWTQNGGVKSLHRCFLTVYYYSDDDGQNWKASNILSLPVSWTKSGLQEPGCVELSTGVLYGWARTDAYCQYEMFSYDFGENWTIPQPSRWSSPCSPLSMKRHKETGTLVAVWNPVPRFPTAPEGYRNEKYNGRWPLAIAAGSDDFKNWGNTIMLEDDPDWGYMSYTSIHFTADSMLLAYTCFNSGYFKTRIRKAPLEDLYMGHTSILFKELL